MTIFESVCFLICGVGVFLIGMKLMGDGLNKGSAKSVRILFEKVSDNRFASYGVGAGTTAIVQSSAATTVMSMGLVGAGIMTTAQAAAFVLGARLGTTATGILVSLSSISITPVLMAFAFVGVCLILFVNNEKVKAVGYVVCGFGVLFAGMHMMTKAITGQEQIAAFFIKIFSAIDFPPLLVLVGALFTAVIQSSSATTGLLITLMNAGTLDVGQAVFLLIGATIGTCVTSLLAAAGAETEGKKIALFNVLTAVLGAIVGGGLVWALKDYVLTGLSYIGQAQWQLSLFGVAYSLVTSFACLPLIKPAVGLLDKLVKDKKKREEFFCFFIEEHALKTPAVALMQVQKETVNLARLAKDNLVLGMKILTTGDLSERKKAETEENRIDFITRSVSEYLVSLAGKNLPYEEERTVGSLHHVVDDLERIGDHAVDAVDVCVKMKEQGVSFSREAAEDLRVLTEKLYVLYDEALQIFESGDPAGLKKFDADKHELHTLKGIFADRHVDRLNTGDCTVKAGATYYTVLTSLERVGDHLENVAYSIKSITGSVEK